MRTRTKITDLSRAQWDRLQLRLQTGYEIPAGIARVCAVFELSTMVERHVEMPIQAFATLMAELAQIGQAETELATVSLSGLPSHLEEARNQADPARAAERAGAPCPEGIPDCPIKHAETDQDAADLLAEISEFPSAEGWPEK